MGFIAKAAAVVVIGVLALHTSAGQDAYAAGRERVLTEVSTVNAMLSGGGVHTHTTTGSPAEVENGGGGSASSWRALALDGAGKPVGWNPCASPKVLVNPTGAPADLVADVQFALTAINKASGLNFVFAGTTDATPRASVDSSYTGSNGVTGQVLIAMDQGRDIINVANAIAGAATTIAGGHRVSGFVVLHSGLFDVAKPGHTVNPTQQAHRGSVLLHELGHVVGLDHIDNPSQVMFEQSGTAGTYGAGDLAGLAALGGHC